MLARLAPFFDFPALELVIHRDEKRLVVSLCDVVCCRPTRGMRGRAGLMFVLRLSWLRREMTSDRLPSRIAIKQSTTRPFGNGVVCNARRIVLGGCGERAWRPDGIAVSSDPRPATGSPVMQPGVLVSICNQNTIGSRRGGRWRAPARSAANTPRINPAAIASLSAQR
jgi:hypothetical protein